MVRAAQLNNRKQSGWQTTWRESWHRGKCHPEFFWLNINSSNKQRRKYGEEEHLVRDGDAVVVPAGTYHNVINTSRRKRNY
jgi:uncharacterized cupin superfamily protein